MQLEVDDEDDGVGEDDDDKDVEDDNVDDVVAD